MAIPFFKEMRIGAYLMKQKIPKASLMASFSMFPLAPYLMAPGKT